MYFRTIVFFTALYFLASFILTAETRFEIIDNEENDLIGVITALDKAQVSINVQDTIHSIPLDKLVKVRSIAPNFYHDSSPQTKDQELLQRMPSVRGANERRTAANLKALQSKEQPDPKTLPSNVIVLELLDGSRLTVTSFTVTNNQGVFRLLGQQNDFSLPLSSIAAVRFVARGLSEIVNPPADWLRLVVADTDGDKLVVGTAGAFEVYTGILDSITAETIAFSIDGEVLPVPRRKVFGFVLHNKSTTVAPAPAAHLLLWSGTQAVVTDLRLAGNELTWQTVSGLNVTVPLEMVEEINFSAKGMATLTDLELVRSELSLPFESNIDPMQLPLLKTFYENRAKNISGKAMLDGTMYEQSITLRGKTLLEYRLPKPFASMKAVIGIEDQYRPFASGTLKVLADSQILGTWDLRGDAASTRIDVNLPQSCRLLTIIAEPPQQLNVPAILTIGEMKLYE